jgi:septal ring factor EnvC (AmiA/AmiB activator)
MKFLKIIAAKDSQMIENFRKSLELLGHQQVKLKRQVKTYLELEANLKVQQKYFDEEKKKQLTILSQIEEDRESHLQAIKEWREAGLKLEEKLKELGSHDNFSQDLKRASFVEKKGSLRPPLFRDILQKYGMIVNDKFQTRIFHKGLFFAAQFKDKVGSIFWGKVAFSGWIDGYGQTIIIDHGDHYYSLYAHNFSLEKKLGEEVSPGETIAQAGDSGSLRGPGLYLEIRHFSESLDPLPWLDLAKPKRL